MQNENESKYFDARLLTPLDPNDERYEQPITITIGPNKDSKNWRHDANTPDVASLIKHLAQHPEDKKKDGWGFVPGDMLPGQRRDSALRALHVVGLDLDLDPDLNVIGDQMVKLGKLAICYTTFTHHKTTTKIKRDELTRFAPNAEHDAALARRYLTEKKYWPTRMTETVEYVGVEHMSEGIMVVVRHKPMVKCRIIIPLKTPFVIADCPTLNAAKEKWRKIVLATAELLGLAGEIDKTGADINRLFYLPRHAPGAEHETMLCSGDLLDWRELELENPWAAEGAKIDGADKTSKSKTAEGKALGE